MMKRINYFAALMLTLMLGIGHGRAVSQNLTPQILWPDPENGALLYGLSDNGDWGVSCVSPGYDGFSDFAGGAIYDLRNDPITYVDLKGKETYCAAFDVTDDGKLVVGSVRQKPAVCRLENGVWTWYELPVPDREFTLTNVYTDEKMTYRLNGGEVYTVTPDGRYAVGMANCIEYINLEVGVMWDLQKGEIMKIPGVNNDNLGRLMMISADGRYVVGRSTVYDLQSGTSKRIPVGLDIYAQGMSTNGKYFSGVVRRNDVPYAAYWDVEKNETTVLDDEVYSDAVAWTITNDGIPFIARPYLTPYADAFVYVDGFLYSFEEIFTQGYGMDLGAYTVENTGKPFKISADGRTLVVITGPGESYVLKLKEDITEAVKKVDLFKHWSASPVSDTRMASVKNVSLSFAHEIEFVGTNNSVKLLNAAGDAVARPKGTGIKAAATTLNLEFSDIPMTPGERYTLRVEAGAIKFKGRREIFNPELNVYYTGREDVPVAPVKINPEEGSALTSISLADNPVTVVFDDMVKLNLAEGAERPVAKIYIDGETDLVGFANLDVDLKTGNTLVIFPDNAIPFYKGSSYSIVVPEGAVCDMSGAGQNEKFVITYEGSLVPQLGDDKYLFRSECDDYTNFLFYEGDHGNPMSEYRNMGFTQDNTPWVVVRDDDYSTDMAFASHSQYNPLVQADDWVATRQIFLPADSKPYLAFDSQSHRKAKTDRLKVIIYENQALINSFNAKIVDDIRANGKLVYDEIQSPGLSEGTMAGEWTHNVIDLSDFAGKSIYICWLNDNYNGSMVMIDNIEVVNDLSAFITIRNKPAVVNEADIAIRGILTVSGETTTYNSVDMTLTDANGNKVSEIKENGLNLKGGDIYNFEFPQALPLNRGEVNKYTVRYTLGEDSYTYQGEVSNLVFEPETRVVLEEFTGRGCVYCPGGLLTIEHLLSLYGDRVIPVALHCFEGSDPKGRNVMEYSNYLGMGAAPMARINRGAPSSPLTQSASGYSFTGSNGEKLWKDLVTEALGTPAVIEIDVRPETATSSTLNYSVYFTSALRLEDTHYRVFGVLVEDGVSDYQHNAYYTSTDPLIGEWGSGGIYGKSIANYVFSHVARGVWGTSYSGTPGLLPTEWKAGHQYKVDMEMRIPEIVDDASKCQMVVMLIDETTGKVINTSRSDIRPTGVHAATDFGNDVRVRVSQGVINVASEGLCRVEAYDVQGRLIATGEGDGSFSVSLGGCKGMVIVRATTAGTSKTEKFMVK